MFKKTLYTLVILIIHNAYAQEEPRFTSFNTGTAFTTITTNSKTKTIWAGTDKKGVYNLDIKPKVLPANFTSFNTQELSDIKIKDMATDSYGNVWVAHQGVNSNGGKGGLEVISSTLSIKHYSPDRNALGFQYYQRDGIGGLRLNSIAVDKNNRVWTVNKNHNLTSGSTFILTPGAYSYKDYDKPKFTTPGAWYDASGKIAKQPSELPYPAYTYNTKPNETPQSRNMQAISVDENSVWMGCWGYIPKKNTKDYIPNRVLKYDLQGKFEKQFTFEDMKFPAGGIINGICANGSKGTWVTTSIKGKGFSVYKNEKWHYLSSNLKDSISSFTQIIPQDARFNDNAIWKDKIGRVFLGTNKGLIVYNGYGKIDRPSSYRVYTNYKFGGEFNVFDETMLSSNITDGSSDNNNTNISWVATDKGIMKVFLPIEGMQLYHVRDHFTYGTSTKNTEENIGLLTALKNTLSDGYALDSEIPRIAADGTNSTLFRFETDDPSGHYNIGSPSYRLIVGPGNSDEIHEEEYIKKYGYFYRKNLSSYEGSPTKADSLKYVEYVYKHPEHIDPKELNTDKNYVTFDFKIVDIVSDPAKPIEIFKHPLKISIPPVLLGHGVWSDVNSVKKLEDYLKSNDFEGYTLKAWRTNGNLAEHPFSIPDYSNSNTINKNTDSWVIPTYIKKLKVKAADNMLSSGKVNVIVHSRGGLYTKAYIEGIDLKYYYEDNIHSLITLNTPHYGAQGSNLALDKRVILTNKTKINTFINDVIDDLTPIKPSPQGLTLGNIGNLSAPELDREKNWGARNLLVEIDNISGISPPEDTRFIEILNSPNNVSKLKEVPIHTISSSFDACSIHEILCNDLGKFDTKLIKAIPKQAKVFVYLYNLFVMVTNDIPNGLNNLIEYVYNGEKSDVIVPLSSMQAGLGNTSYNSHFLNITHSNLIPGTPSITEAPQVHERVKELLKSNVNDDSNNGKFTKKGITQSPLTYTILPKFKGNFISDSISSKILINRTPSIFDNRSIGDTLNYKVYTEDVDKIIVSYENENAEGSFSYEIRHNNKLFVNNFSFEIPNNFYGKTTITANGYKKGVLGYTTSSVTFNTALGNEITLQKIQFEHKDPILINKESYPLNVIGTYSDGIKRKINNLDNIAFTIQDTLIISQINNKFIKGKSKGNTLITASVNGFEDTILATVEENPALYKTLLTNFYGELNLNNSEIKVSWETLREFKNKTFVLEKSYSSSGNFTEINKQAGNGTTEEASKLSFIDTSLGANEVIFYRLKMISESGKNSYSSIIKIDRKTLATKTQNTLISNLKIYPNPVKSETINLYLSSSFKDQNATLELYSLQGKKLSFENLNIMRGENNFKLKLPKQLDNGIYLIRVNTSEFIKSVKLIIDN